MQVFKLTKEDKQLLVEATPKTYLAAINNGWGYELIEVDDNTLLNSYSEIR